jgi:hypothetical protein
MEGYGALGIDPLHARFSCRVSGTIFVGLRDVRKTARLLLLAAGGRVVIGHFL